jgi:hypothetical protein
MDRDSYLDNLKDGTGGRKKEWDEVRTRYGGYGVLQPLCILGYSSFVAVEDAYVRDCRGIGRVATVD